MKNICTNCHFLICNILSNDSNNWEKHSLSAEQRLSIKDIAKCNIRNKPFYINCYQGIWDIKTFNDDNDLYNTIKNKRECKKYKDYQENMTLEAAENIMQEKDNNKNINKVKRTTIIASIIGAVVGSSITILITYLLKI